MTTDGTVRKKGTGLYFNATTSEILRVDDAVVDPGQSWTKFSDDYSWGLLAARRELERRGLVNDASAVQWFGLTASNSLEAQALSQFVSRLKRASDDATRRAGDTPSFLRLLAERLRYIVEGSSIDGGHAAPLAVVPVSTETPKHYRNRSGNRTER